MYSAIAQRWSTRLLTDRLKVRILFAEPISGDYGMKDTPVPIPNTTVKLHSANGTALETVWKSRTSPGYKWIFSSVG